MQSMVPQTFQSSHPSGVDILRDGFLAHMFGVFTELFFQSLLKTSVRSLPVQFPLHGWPSAFALSQGAVTSLQPNVVDAYQYPYLLLDLLVNTAIGPVVPQTLWVPRSSRDLAQYVLEATLELPIFFVRNDGGIGITVADASAGNSASLLGSTRAVNVGGRTSVHLRIQWPGYKEWRRQFQTRDETAARSVITLDRFIRHVGRSLDRFLEAMSSEIPDGFPQWRIGPNAIGRQDITIVGVAHVSSGSWMPILQLTRPLLV
ncbi:hypothetical protein PENSPDRAFT_754594 [Peniophora sp. CONT]|nr:hypothetical protein PENSPDRAFT_754594 [Peniophora sp. CONT]